MNQRDHGSMSSGPTNEQDLSALLQRFYDDLRRLARARMRRLPDWRTLHTTGLVHDAYLRLKKKRAEAWDDHRHFFGDMAQAMRDIVAEHVRRKQALKHGGGLVRVDAQATLADGARPSHLSVEQSIALLDALQTMQREYPDHAHLVFLRYFGGLSMAELAETLGMSLRSVERKWTFARSWLYKQLTAP